VNKQIPTYLKLVTDTINQTPAAVTEDLAGLTGICRAFEQATGWRLEVDTAGESSEQTNLMWSAPVNPGVGNSPGHIRLFSAETHAGRHTPRIPLEPASMLAAALGDLWGELLATRHALGQREAELASGVPLIVRTDDDESPPMAERLEAVLRGGAEAIGCQAAGLYLLDSATTELKLRSSWGLPRNRLTQPARPLRGALADLEAMLGHAVVLADNHLRDYWKVPEDNFGATLCVPISRGSMPLGTLWAFCDQARDFSSAETNIWEVVAGRLAADLERQVLVDEAVSARDQLRQVEAAQRLQHEQLPRIAPKLDGWDIAARADQLGPLGGAFYDWFAPAGGGLSLLAGQALSGGMSGALIAAGLRAAVRALGEQQLASGVLLSRANSILWTGSAGNACAALFQATIKTNSDLIGLSVAGPLRVLSIRGAGVAVVAGPSDALGVQEELRVEQVARTITPGELLLVYGTGQLPIAAQHNLAALDRRLLAALKPFAARPADELVAICSELLRKDPAPKLTDRVLLAIKRRR
jgi:GAF domain-containing protein